MVTVILATAIYFFIASIVAGVVRAIGYDQELAFFYGILCPFVLAALPFYGICKLAEAIAKRVMVTKKHKGWINIVRERGDSQTQAGLEIFATEQEAKEAYYSNYEKLATTHIEWEE